MRKHHLLENRTILDQRGIAVVIAKSGQFSGGCYADGAMAATSIVRFSKDKKNA